MKAILALVGLAASLFAGMHALVLAGSLMEGLGAGPYGPTRMLAHVVGAAFGLLVAVVCFRKCAGKPADTTADFDH